MELVKRKVLLIEDDKDLRETTSELLGQEGFEVIASENGSIGIQLAIQRRPDVIVCDITMNGVTGYEVFNILRQINTTSVIPFIFLSAKAAKEDILLGLHLGADDYIIKPFEISHLVKIINLRIESRKKILELNDEKFNVLLNNTFSGAFILNGNTIEHANQQFAKSLGYFQDELAGNSIINLVHKDDVRKIADFITRCTEGAINDFEASFKAIRKDNNLVTFNIKGSNIEYKGEKRLVATVIEARESGEDLREEIKLSSTIKLSTRELEILKLICLGLSNAEIATKLFLSERTIEGHRARIYMKTETKSAVSLALWAVKRKLINP